MTNRTQLKGVKKQRFNSKTGKRNRFKRKKSVAERKKIKRMLQRMNNRLTQEEVKNE